MSKLNIARILLAIGLIIGLESLYATFTHIGDPLFTLQPEFGGGTTHSWYHALREAMGDVRKPIVVLLLLFFGQAIIPDCGNMVDRADPDDWLLLAFLDWHAVQFGTCRAYPGS